METAQPEWLSLTQVSRLFGQDRRTIKRRMLAGEFEFKVGPDGFLISRESIDRHMKELEERHARRG
jgi:hypothetical protein